MFAERFFVKRYVDLKLSCEINTKKSIFLYDLTLW